MKKVIPIFIIFLLVGCSGGLEERDSNAEKEPDQDGMQVNGLLNNGKVITTNLDVPWDVIKHGDEFFISQRGGQILKVTADGKKSVMPLELNKQVAHTGEGGLLGFVLHPDYDSNRLAYIYHTYKNGEQVQNRIVKIKREGDSWVEQSVLTKGIPGGFIHNGGRLEIGPDGKLYVTVGDAGHAENAQKLNSLSGKILRMNLDGSIPGDNPFSNSYIYSYGHRNPQGLAWSENGVLYEAEHGQTAHDEINIIQPGKNYGWPVIQGSEEKEGMVTPLFHSGTTTWAPSGLAYYDGKLFVACLRGQQIRQFDLEKQTSKIVLDNVGRIRDVLVKDHALYVLTNNTDGRGNPGPKDDYLIKLDLPVE